MTPEQYITQLAHSLYTGTHTGDVDGYLVHHTAQQLMQQCYTGWGTSFDTPGIAAHDFEQLKSFEENIYTFSAFKNHRFINECAALLKNSGDKKLSYEEFLAGVKTISNTYHNKYAAKEADNVLTTVKAIKQWQTILKQKDQWPYLTWKADKKDSTCKVCNSLNNTCLPVEHSFWTTHFIPAHYGCHCKIVQGKNVHDVTPGNKIPQPTYTNGMFERNAGIGGVAVNPRHPYYNIDRQQSGLIKTNNRSLLPERNYHYPVNEKSIQELIDKKVEFRVNGQSVDAAIAANYIKKHGNGFNPLQLIQQLEAATAGIYADWDYRGIDLQNSKGNGSIIMHWQFDSKNVSIYRSFKDTHNGIVASHDFLSVHNSDYQGAGISKGLSIAFYNQYRNMQVKRIDVKAGLDKGGYTWAKYDFRITNRLDAYKIVVGAQASLTKEQYEKVQTVFDNYYNHNPRGQDFPIKEIADMQFAKPFLEKTNWEGAVNLEDEKNRTNFENYMNWR